MEGECISTLLLVATRSYDFFGRESKLAPWVLSTRVRDRLDR